MKHAIRLLVSAACSALVAGLLLSLASSLGGGAAPSDVLAALRSALPAFVAAYALCQLLQALARAQRARVLLRASLAGAGSGAARNRVPGLFHTLLVTFVRGACADMLPARLGELSYVAMLNRGCAVPAADCLSSLSIGLLFDFLALLAVLAVAVPAAAQGLSLVGSTVVLAAVCAAGVALLFFALPVAAGWRWERLAPFRWRPGAWLLQFTRDVAAAVVAVRRGRVAGRVLALSVAVRAAKYAGLYALFVAVTRPLWPALSHAPVAAVLVALVAAEGAASLPVPTFMSFGSYEAGGLAALTALGFPAGDSLVAMLAMHLLSQAIDYSLGGLAFLVFSWIAKPGAPTPPSETSLPSSPAAPSPSPPPSEREAARSASLHLPPSERGVARSAGGSTPCAAGPAPSVSRNRAGRAPLGRLFLALLFLCASLLFLVWQAHAIQKRGRLVAPPKGEAVEPTEAEAAARDAMLRAFGGRIVWSSNRSGSHDLWILDGPGALPRRLTRSGFTDTYPRFSPDGTKVCFSRSREPWVSQRNFDKWDTWVLDLATGEERLVATNAYQACWDPTAPVLYAVRAGGSRLVRSAIDGGEESVLLESGIPPLGDGVRITLPDAHAGDPMFALTLRGAKNATVHVRLADGTKLRESELREIAGGCQMVWRGGNPRDFVWMDHPGHKGTAVYTQDAEGRRTVLLDNPGDWSHEYFPQFAGEGRWLVYGASTGGHEQDSEDYEIFLWDTADTNTPPARLTFHTGNDGWPDLFLPRTPKPLEP